MGSSTGLERSGEHNDTTTLKKGSVPTRGFICSCKDGPTVLGAQASSPARVQSNQLSQWLSVRRDAGRRGRLRSQDREAFLQEPLKHMGRREALTTSKFLYYLLNFPFLNTSRPLGLQRDFDTQPVRRDRLESHFVIAILFNAECV